MILAVLSVGGGVKMAFNGLVVKGELCFGFQLPEHGHLKFNKGVCSRKSEELLVNTSAGTVEAGELS